MVVPRLFLRQTAQFATRSMPRSQSWQKVQQRAYAGGSSYVPPKHKSDIPWAIGAVVVTVPSTWYILRPKPKKDHGHGHGDSKHEDHGKEHESTKDDGAGKEGSSEEEIANEEKHEEKPNDSETETDGDTDNAANSDDESESGVQVKEGGGDVDGVQFKGPTSGGTEEGVQGDTRKHVPDAKGVSKKRIESDYGKRQGVADETKASIEDDDTALDKPAASKPPGGPNSMSAKQEGIANTDTKHSTDITHNPDISKKGEGMPETAKTKGTVEISRPGV